jgi:hypothetical protein
VRLASAVGEYPKISDQQGFASTIHSSLSIGADSKENHARKLVLDDGLIGEKEEEII